MEKRESLGSRLGFILISAGCAIGLGNVWRFPYITGKNGGACFVLFYILFLFLFGLPVMVMEFSIGRASRQNIGNALKTLEKPKTKWHTFGPIAIVGNYILMMFYTTIAGWLIYYFTSACVGKLNNINLEKSVSLFTDLTLNPVLQIIYMVVAVGICMFVVGIGLQKGVEKITKVMMVALISIMIFLAINSAFLPGFKSGIKFYLMPNFAAMKEIGIGVVLHEALCQAFFTLSIGIGNMAIFGSYIGKEHSLTGESIRIISLDTFVALVSGLIIFPACFSFNVEVGQGPSLLFITLPTIFDQMKLGQLWALLFFLFMSFAALSTVIAVFENIISYFIDVKGMERKKAAIINFVLISILSIPCILGFNLLSNIQPFGPGSGILDAEDFIVSNILLPFGSLLFVLFTTLKCGWGFDNFLKEANTGKGIKFSKGLRVYVSYVIPVVILFILLQGIISKL